MEQLNQDQIAVSAESGIVPVAVPGSQNKHLWYWLIIILAAFLAAFIVLKQVAKPDQVAPIGTDLVHKRVISNQLPEGYQINVVTDKGYPQGFPVNLVLAKGSINILSSQDNVTKDGTHYKIVDLQTSDQPDALVLSYKSYLASQGWQLSVVSPEANLQTLPFNKGSVQFIVIIMAKNSGSQLNLTYISK
jgi:hypothetical protein